MRQDREIVDSRAGQTKPPLIAQSKTAHYIIPRRRLCATTARGTSSTRRVFAVDLDVAKEGIMTSCSTDPGLEREMSGGAVLVPEAPEDARYSMIRPSNPSPLTQPSEHQQQSLLQQQALDARLAAGRWATLPPCLVGTSVHVAPVHGCCHESRQTEPAFVSLVLNCTSPMAG
ncbi:hypothetical protein T440DRAFT_67166 [Plenodomus tracheiphilus IPT5]|uniref:Uncharacterized protein n=1 Tax=Plenodomus tracheiphilus IPT5 TaxID=1408161 RepID=A0A6A7B7W8_9PLEO|nr:hypothetical protein T440DRAFT_67166 [Plenodomus tracheiphilus IPT5]